MAALHKKIKNRGKKSDTSISFNKQLMNNDIYRTDSISFQSYGVKIEIRADEPELLRDVYTKLGRVFPNGLEPAIESEIEYRFYIKSLESVKYELFRNEEKLCEDGGKELFLNMVESQLRITVAEFAVEKVFLHAGVVGWKGRAIVIPATSFSGKTTLVAELVKKGALYYSDEYAVLNALGNVEPFPKWLSMRGITDAINQKDCSVESLGGTAGTKPLPVGMVLIARYQSGKKIPRRWKPKRLTQGEAIMEIIPHTLPIRNKPKFVLEVLNKLTDRAIIVRTIRGEAAEFAETLLGYFESEIK